jgi:murein DD-endopeptidase MepM/ murein hydrolase activator NlpD
VAVAIGLICYSRIAFLLSVLGYTSAYLFYLIIGADFNELNYSFIGFNYILTAIAIGGFYIVASPYSFAWVIILTPVISVFVSGTSVILSLLQLSVYSLPFNISVLLFLYVLRLRETPGNFLQLVSVQEYSPEKNLYNQKNFEYRFPAGYYVSIRLPFLGEWKVTQGHSGEITHRENWKHAWDFEITDENEQTYQNKGLQLSDYYCFNKPVIAPAAGYVEEVCSHLEDNTIGDVDLLNNWGNTVVIKHSESLYSKLSHLRKDSITVSKGEKVSAGQIIGSCGNSGRSPYPHLHFQLQATPYIGSYTVQYPVSQYVTCNADQNLFAANAIPQKGEHVLNLNTNHSLSEAFHFIPGQIIEFEITFSDGSIKNERWEVLSDMFNQTYLHSAQSNSKAYFVNTEGLFYFTWFEGKQNSLLRYFYLGAYKVSAGYYNKLIITDVFPLKVLKNNWLKMIQDIVAPFYIFSRISYTMRYVKMTDMLHECEIQLQSSCKFSMFKHTTATVDFEIFIANNQIDRFEILENGKITKARRIKSTAP